MLVLIRGPAWEVTVLRYLLLISDQRVDKRFSTPGSQQMELHLPFIGESQTPLRRLDAFVMMGALLGETIRLGSLYCSMVL